MRAPHDLHGVLDVAPLFCFFRLALALASDRFLGRLGDSLQAVLLEHLPRDHVNLRLGYHVALPEVPPFRASGDQLRSLTCPLPNGPTGALVPSPTGPSAHWAAANVWMARVARMGTYLPSCAC